MMDEILKNDVKNAMELSRVWALAHGIIKRLENKDKREKANYVVTNLPYTLYPTLFPESSYNNSLKLQEIINKLYCNIVLDSNFLLQIFKIISNKDPFIQKLYQIYISLLQDGFKQETQFALIRADYLLNQISNLSSTREAIKQVEVNCIAASFGGISPRIAKLHDFITSQYKFIKLENVKFPISNSLQLLSNGLIQAWKHYKNMKSIIVFVVEELSLNEFDQRYLEWEILKGESRIKVKRYTFEELSDKAHVDLKTFALNVSGDEVGVVYYRTGYGPQDYHSDKAWDVRLLMEKSMAIKCPSIQFQLAGTKLVQEKLSQPGILEQFSMDAEECALLRETFVKFYPVDGESGKENIEYAIQHHDDLVLKPLREGGGHNLYGEDIKKFLERYKLSKRDTLPSKTTDGVAFSWSDDANFPPLDLPFILMERIKPSSHPNYVIKTSSLSSSPPSNESRDISEVLEPSPVPMISELGIFGAVLCSKSKGLIYSKVGGYLLRSKPDTSNETGIVAGFGALDSLALY